MDHVLNLHRKPRIVENDAVDASEDPIAMSLLPWPTSRLTVRRVSSRAATRKDSQGLSPYDDDVDGDDRDAGDAASLYDRGPAAIAR